MQHQSSADILLTMQDSPSQRARSSARSPGMRILTRVSSTSMRRTGPSPHAAGSPMDYAGAVSPHSGHYVHSTPARSLDYFGFRIPYAPQSTPIHQPFNLPTQHETFCSQIDSNAGWVPKDVQLRDVADPNMSRTRRRFSSKRLQKESNQSDAGDSRFLLNESSLNDGSPDPSKRSPKRESLMEWFDRTVEKELRKRREGSLNIGENLVNLESPSHFPVNTSGSRSRQLLRQASASGIDIRADLEGQQDTELMDAVDKLAKAEAMCAFEGAVKAAEQAAAAAPPEYAEEAAAASAQGFQAELTSVVKQEIDGVKPIEVVGYVGITRPKKPKKSNVDS